jgi:hypothetical protein
MTAAKAKPAKPEPSANPQPRIDSFLAKYTREVEELGRAALAKMRKRLPHAIEFVYDNYNALVFGRAERAAVGRCFFNRAISGPRGAVLLAGAKLPDPHKRLRGNGNVVRNVRVDDVTLLDDPAIATLIDEALQRAKVPMDPKGKRKLVIRSVSAKQRPRRP